MSVPYAIVAVFSRFLLRRIVKVEILGRENLPQKEGYFIIAEHKSRLDPFWVNALLEKNLVSVVVDKGLYNWRGLSWFLKQAERDGDMIVVQRRSLPESHPANYKGLLKLFFRGDSSAAQLEVRTGKIPPSSFRKIARNIRSGRPILWFPTGYMYIEKELEQGVVRIAERLECPIVPVKLPGKIDSLRQMMTARVVIGRSFKIRDLEKEINISEKGQRIKALTQMLTRKMSLLEGGEDD